MSNSIWQKIDEIFPLVADLPAGERETRLRELCGDDEELRREVLALLAADEKASDFCEIPAVLPNSLAGAFAFSQREAQTDSQAGRKIGAYLVLSKLGAGGMGAVYLARRDDGAFEKKVAVKFIRRGVESDFNLRRFRHERQVLAALEHPHIARLLDGGTTPDGSPFFVMEYVEGKTLFDYCDSKALDLTARLELFRQICAAVGYAHERRIVHRDLKPGNILVSGDGAVKLLDFGIAKILDEDLVGEPVAQTETLLRQMTPEYASPEQIKGEEITPLSDVYSLGVILYELTTGERPYKFPSRAPHEMARIVCEEKVRIPHYKFQIPNAEDLSFIILKALRKEPSERFASVHALDGDLERFMRGLPVQTEETRLKFFDKAANDSGGMTVSLAVAPFRILPNGSGEPSDAPLDDFFAVGLADALTTKLSGIRRLAVRPTSSVLRAAKGGKDACAVGRQLGADYVIEGHILRSGAQLRVSVQLLNTGDFSVLWAEQFDETESDVFRLQDSISARVAAALVPRLTSDEEKILHRHGTENAAAYKAYLRGRVFFHNYTFGGMSAAENCFAQAIAHDPNFALAHCGLADFYNMQTIFGLTTNRQSFARAKSSALRAIELDPNLAEAYAALAFTTWACDWDFAEAEALFKKSIRLNPNYPRAHEWYAFLLSVTERHDEALAAMRRAERLDPDSPALVTMFALVYYNARRFEEALAKTRRALELDQDYYIALQSLGWICPRLGKFDEGVEGCRRAVLISDEQALNKFSLALALIDAGQTSEARAIAAEFETRRETGAVPAYYLAVLYAALGEDERAFGWFDRAIEERGYYTLRMRVEPRLDRLRSDPRFTALLERIKPTVASPETVAAFSSETDKIDVPGKPKARAAVFAAAALALFVCLGLAWKFHLASDESIPVVSQNQQIAAPPAERAASEKPPTSDAAAAELYEAGKKQLETRSLDGVNRAVKLFTEATRRDPNFALAFSGLADAHIVLADKDPKTAANAYRTAEEHALKALSLDPDLAEARTSLAMTTYKNTGNIAAAEKHFLRAIEINPRLPRAHHWYSQLLRASKRDEEALREIKIAAELEPRSAILQFNVGVVQVSLGNFREANAHFDKAIELDGNYTNTYLGKSITQQMLGDYDAAVETYRIGLIQMGKDEKDPLWILMQAQAHAANNRREQALTTLDNLLRNPTAPREEMAKLTFDIVLVYVLLGDVGKSCEWLGKVEKVKIDPEKISLDPRLANIKDAPCFTGLLDKWKAAARTPKEKQKF